MARQQYLLLSSSCHPLRIKSSRRGKDSFLYKKIRSIVFMCVTFLPGEMGLGNWEFWSGVK